MDVETGAVTMEPVYATKAIYHRFASQEVARIIVTAMEPAE